MSVDHEWKSAMDDVLAFGDKVSPRGKETTEILHATTTIDMKWPVIASPLRKLSYKFMAAEAWWMTNGLDTVADIAPWNKNIAQFSDDGVTFHGAYGPRIEEQLQYVVQTLVNDPDTRQAVITTWRPNPPKTKDVPCTVCFDFKIRKGALQLSVYMRSSDLWLGFPYDVFNFSMVAVRVCWRVNFYRREQGLPLLEPGMLRLTAGSMHLYSHNYEAAQACIEESNVPFRTPVPPEFYLDVNEWHWRNALKEIRDGNKEARWWL